MVEDQLIQQARRRRQWLMLGFAALLLVALAAYLVWLLLTRGYDFRLAPLEARDGYTVTVVSGRAFAMGGKLFQLGGEGSEVEINAPRFLPKRVIVGPDAGAVIEVELEPAPGRVEIGTEPALDDVVWSLDGAVVAQAARLSLTLPPGEYTVGAVHPYFQDHTTMARVASEATHAENLRLAPVSGQITLDSSPAGAAVTINGAAAGATPLVFSGVGGAYQVRVAHAGYQTIDDRVEITARLPAPRRDYRLLRQQAALLFQLDPAGGILTVDGQAVAGDSVSVAVGRPIQVNYQKPGFHPATTRVTLSIGQQKTVALSLRAAMGEVTFNANLPAEVFINGKAAGPTPLTLSLPNTEHAVAFRRGGHRAVTKTVVPLAGQAINVQARLLTEYEARRAGGAAKITDRLGIKMARFQPSAYTMGAPANEAERQSHEYPVRVDFTRPIAVSTHEITEAQFAASGGRQSTSRLPQSNIAWQDAARFCNWLSRQEGLPLFYRERDGRVVGWDATAVGYRLPSEAEWEWLAKRAKRPRPTRYVWGDGVRVPKSAGNFADQSLAGAQIFTLTDYQDAHSGKAEVGSYRADRAGLHDLAGNVAEWAHDFFSFLPPHLGVVHSDYLGPAQGNGHVVKGGSYLTGQLSRLRGAFRREGKAPAADVGFRVARYLK